MSLGSKFLMVLCTVVLTASYSEAGKQSNNDLRGGKGGGRNSGGRQEQDQNQNGADTSRNSRDSYNTDVLPKNDSEIVKVVSAQKGAYYVQGSGMVVKTILPDDTQGAQHQKFIVTLSNGQNMMAVYNSDMCERVPVKVGDVVAMGGQFIWTDRGALLHWLHRDPRKTRPDGYVYVNGKYYCK